MFVPIVPVVAAYSSQPAAMPRLNVEPSCRAASDFKLSDSQSFTECMRDEADAKREIAKGWSNYSAAARARCGGEVLIGGPASYVEMYECLDIDRLLASRPRSVLKR